MTSPLAIQLMRFAFLVLLWLFLYGMVRVIRAELRTAGARRVPVPAKPKSKRARAAASDGRPGRGALSQLIVTEGSLAGTRVALAGKPILIGRANDSTLVLTDDYASTRHARLVSRDGDWYVEDLGSTNGTSVNGHTVGTQPLQHGDVIRVGHTRLVFHEDDS